MKYFAYGSNMLEQWLRRRVPSAKTASNGYLRGRQLRFQKRSKDGSGKCDIPRNKNPSDLVLGVLYDIADSEMAKLDAAEGAGQGYKRITIEVLRESEDSIVAETYVAEDSHIDSSLKPYSWYRGLVAAGARQHGFDARYIEEIEAIAATEDKDEKRAFPALEALKGFRSELVSRGPQKRTS